MLRHWDETHGRRDAIRYSGVRWVSHHAGVAVRILADK